MWAGTWHHALVSQCSLPWRHLPALQMHRTRWVHTSQLSACRSCRSTCRTRCSLHCTLAGSLSPKRPWRCSRQLCRLPVLAMHRMGWHCTWQLSLCQVSTMLFLTRCSLRCTLAGTWIPRPVLQCNLPWRHWLVQRMRHTGWVSTWQLSDSRPSTSRCLTRCSLRCRWAGTWIPRPVLQCNLPWRRLQGRLMHHKHWPHMSQR